MAAPDVAGYVDLRLVDADAQDLVDRALLDAAVKFPEWEPREGNTELVLLEGMALQVAELTFAANRLPGTVTEVLLRLFDLSRDVGAAPRFTVALTTSNAGQAITVPAGTRFGLELDGGLRLELTLDADVPVAAAGTTNGTATATEPTLAANTLAPRTALEVLDAVAYLDAATASILDLGRDSEDGAAFLDRGVIRLRRLVTTLTLPDHFTAAALEDVRVKRARTIDAYDPAVGPAPAAGSTTGTNLGHVTVAVAGPGGALLTAPIRTAIENALEVQALAGLDVHVIDATVNVVTVAAVVVQRAGFLTAVADSVAALDLYLDPDAWTFGGTVYRNELIALLDRVPSVERVVSVTLTGANGAGDLVLTGVAPLVNLGVATVTLGA